MSRCVEGFDRIKIKKLRHGRGGRVAADVVVSAGGRRVRVVAACGVEIWDAEKSVSCDGLDLASSPSVIGFRTNRQGYAPHDWWLQEGDVLVTDPVADGGFRRVPANFAAELGRGGVGGPVKVSHGRLVGEALLALHASGPQWF